MSYSTSPAESLGILVLVGGERGEGMWHLHALANYNYINFFGATSIGVDCLLITVIIYSYFITCPPGFPSEHSDMISI